MRLEVNNQNEKFNSNTSIADLAQFYNFNDVIANIAKFKIEYKHEIETSFEDAYGTYFIFKDGSELKVFYE